MDKVYDQTKVEEKWYKFWEENGFFKPEINPDGQPYTIILPPPNANADLHFGHAMFVIEDILIRYHRMKGYSTLWLPGSDHAGFETQVVFEKHLEKEGKSRFDFDRPTLYQMIWDFVQKNKGGMENQLRRLGFSLDWTREKFTLDPDIIKLVYKTFKKMSDDQLIYRANKLVNYCTKHGTGFSDLEVAYIERKSPLYFVKFPFEGDGYIIIATTRPETILGDVAVMVNPKDKRYQNQVGQQVRLPLTDRLIPIIADEHVDISFGTGAVKVTPNHDMNDYEIAKKHDLDFPPVIGFDGRMTEQAGKYSSMKVNEARAAVVEELKEKGLLEKIDEEYINRIGTCYKCGTVLEPLPLEQWFISIKPLAEKAIQAVDQKNIKIYPQNFETALQNWMTNLRDWNISRQTVWGIQIPAWYCISCNDWIVTEGEEPEKCPNCGNNKLERDTDTFDTWFSSSQWPFVTLQTISSADFDKFYPTSVMETGRDILYIWVSRMIMMGLYNTDQKPFSDVLLHGLVLDPLGKKMSKSKANVVSPMEIADQYGADAARMALVYGTATGHDQVLNYPKLDAMRKFTNKLWNMGRFIIEFKPENSATIISDHPDDQAIIKQLGHQVEKTSQAIDQYRFNAAAESLYEFIWHEFADKYIEKTKDRRAQAQPTLEHVFQTCLELLHPFMPFITEELWQKLVLSDVEGLTPKAKSIMLTNWPTTKNS